jgi:hypothetical protein
MRAPNVLDLFLTNAREFAISIGSWSNPAERETRRPRASAQTR